MAGIKCSDDTSDKEMNIYELLRNPRVCLKLKREALDKILQDDFQEPETILHTLQDLIIFEGKLRYMAFKKLLDILPNDYMKQGYPVNLKTIVECLVNSDVTMDDVEKLMKKDMAGNLASIISMVIQRIYMNPDDSKVGIEILREIFEMKEYRHILTCEQLTMLSQVATRTTDLGHRKNLMTIMHRNIYDSDNSTYGGQIRNMEFLLNANFSKRDHVEKVREIIESGMRTTENKLEDLIKTLNNDFHGEKLLELLAKQNLSCELQKEFLKKLVSNPALLKYKVTYIILVNCLLSGFKVQENIFKMTSTYVNDDALSCYVFELAKYSSQNEPLVNLAKRTVFDSKKGLKQRIAAADYLSNVIDTVSLKSSFKPLLSIALEKVSQWEQFELSSLAFQCIVRIKPKSIESILIDYYKNMKAMIYDQNIDDLSKLDAFITDWSHSADDKIRFLNTLWYVFFKGQQRVTKFRNKTNEAIGVEIFENVSPSLWRQKLLCYSLKFGTILENCEFEDSYEVHYKTFTFCVENLKKSLTELYTIEDVLTRLVYKQNILRLNIKEIIDFLILLKNPINLSAFFKNHVEFEIDLSTMKMNWLSQTLAECDLEVDEGERFRVNMLLMYNLALVEKMLSHIKGRNEFDNFLETLTILNNCDANLETKEKFLNQGISEDLSFIEWKMQLFSFAMRFGFKNKVKNAYNQAHNVYNYKFDDMKTIAIQLMENHPFKLVFVLKIENLKYVLHFTQTNNVVIFLMKISKGHWVIMVITKSNDDIFALYKDSFGKYFSKERKKIETIVKEYFFNVKFFFHENQEQIEKSNGAVFALSNLYLLTNKITNDKKFFEEFKRMSFATEEMVNEMKTNEFPKLYAKGSSVNYLHCENIKIPSLKNAYNQAKLPYKYNLDDITTIASQLLKYHVDNFKLIIVLKMVDLRRVARSFLEEKKDYVLLLNISDDHWITFAMFYYGDEEVIVLYKDSLGAEEFRRERKQVEVLLKDAIPRLKMIYHKSQEQLEYFSGGVFALSNLTIIVKELLENRANFIKQFENWSFCSQTTANENRAVNFPKHYAVYSCIEYKKEDIVKHHQEELINLKNILKSHMENFAITIHGEKISDGEKNLVISLAFPKDETLYDSSYKYLYSISTKKGNFTSDANLKNDIIQSLGAKKIYSITKYTIQIASEDVPIVKKGKMNLKVYNSKVSDDRIIDILKRLNVTPDELNKKQISRYFEKSMGYKIYKYELTENDVSKVVHDIDSVLAGMSNGIIKLFEVGWDFDFVHELIDLEADGEYLEELEKCMNIIWEYKLREYDRNGFGSRLIDILRERSLEKMEKQTHEVAIKVTFKRSLEKTLPELSNEMFELNKENIEKEELKSIMDMYGSVLKCYNGKSSQHRNENNISEWNGPMLKKWSESVSGATQYEKLAVIKRAVEVARGFSPRDTQMLAVISSINEGRVVEVSAGEGKPLIIAMMAAFQVLQGRKVDVITGLPQAVEHERFYDLLNLKSHAFSESPDKVEDVLHGCVNEFQRDSPQRDIFTGVLPPRESNRPHDVAILAVDGLDAMLTDDRFDIMKLSTPLPGMASLQICLAAIWRQVELTVKHIVDNGGRLESEGEKISLTNSEFITFNTELFIRTLIRDTSRLPAEYRHVEKNHPEIFIPNHLRDFVTAVQIPNWIKSCIDAKFKLELNKDYVIKDTNKIYPLHETSSGFHGKDASLSNGKLQFLQMKHGAELTPEVLASDHVSNVSFFKKYGKKLYGVIGKVGDKRTKELIAKEYRVKFISIPTFKEKQFSELQPIIVSDKKEWLDCIVENSIQKLRNLRAIVMIVSNVDDAEKIANMLVETGCQRLNLMIINEESGIVRKTLEAGQTIIAIGDSGRRIDVEVSDEVERNGGLDVCLTNMPDKSRVLEQYMEMTSKIGQRGTAQFILYDVAGRSIDELIAECEEEERKRLTEDEKEIRRATDRDVTIKWFSSLLGKLKGLSKSESEAINERFGLWLKIAESNYNYKNKDYLKIEFKKFKLQIEEDHSKKDLIKNPFYFMRDGTEKLTNEDFRNAKYDYDCAIRKDYRFSDNAFYGRACANIAIYGEKVSENREILKGTVFDYQKARKLFDERKKELMFIGECSKSLVFSEQILHKINLIEIQNIAINCAIGIDRTKLKAEIEKLKKMKPKNNRLEHERICKEIATLERQMEDIGVLGKALKGDKKIDINFISIEKSLPKNYMDVYRGTWNELKINGFVGEVVILGIRSIPWSTVIGVCTIGLAQIATGVAVAFNTGGSLLSASYKLISEGVTDIIIAIKDGIIDKTLSWLTWGVHKAVNFALIMLSAGSKAIKRTANAVLSKTTTTTVAAASKTVRVGWKTVTTKVCFLVAKGIGREIMNDLVNYGINNKMVPKIQEIVYEKLEEPIKTFVVKNEMVQKMLEQDAINGNEYFQIEIERLVSTIVEEKMEIFEFLKTIFTTKENEDSLFELNKIGQFVPEVTKKIDDKIQECAIDNKLLEEENMSEEIIDNLQTDVDSKDAPSSLEIDDLDLNKNQDLQQVDFNTNKQYLARKFENPLAVILGERISSKICKNIVNFILLPMKETAAVFTMGRLPEMEKMIVKACKD